MQGVGFRPFVYQLALHSGLTGWVINAADGVHVELNADKNTAIQFLTALLSNAPPLARITSHHIEEKSFIPYDDFKILTSIHKRSAGLLTSPDFAICTLCREEIRDPHNRRFQYAFTTCTQCGPRFSIMNRHPYDRDNTSMASFDMCNACRDEYHDPLNRRHFSQTNSCAECGVNINLFDIKKQLIETNQEKIITTVCSLWDEGKIVALKGIGGFLLTCDAANPSVIKELRKRKHRPAKPFALMFPDIVSLEKEVSLHDHEMAELNHVAAPIVLLHVRNKISSALSLREIAPGLSSIGVMLPYAPLYQLLMHQYAKPIVATSANLSNAPIIYKDEMVFNELAAIADFVLTHNRDIIESQDDSVVAYSRQSHQRIVIRRSRGFAPLFIGKDLPLPRNTILATGAEIKSCFTLLHGQDIHISQYLGDTGNFDARENFNLTIHHFLEMLDARPEIILADKHPEYYITLLGKRWADEWGSQFIRVQHHEAHFASVLGEHLLMDDQDPVLGVIWDGTGYGHDNQIWGGEFFRYHQQKISRESFFNYFDHFLWDKMASEPRISAFSLCYDLEEAQTLLQSKFSHAEWNNYHLLIRDNKLKTSSVGRMFDGVASLMGLIDKSSYEGEAAMLLEEEGLKYFKGDYKIPPDWLEYKTNPMDIKPMVSQILAQLHAGTDTSQIAAYFHVWLVMVIRQKAAEYSYTKICFSGGVFQNRLLVDLIIMLLSPEYKLYFNKELPPNDENISFGQLIHFIIHHP